MAKVVLEELGKNIVIFWGSQSGTAERFAQKFSRDLKLKLGLESLVADLSDYDAQSIAALTDRHLAVFFISTSQRCFHSGNWPFASVHDVRGH